MSKVHNMNVGASWSAPFPNGISAGLTPGLYELTVHQQSKSNPTGIIITDSLGNTSNTFLGDGSWYYSVASTSGGLTQPNLVTVAIQAGGAGITNIMLARCDHGGIGQNSPIGETDQSSVDGNA